MKENRSVSRMLSILELISRNPDGLTLGEIYRKLEIPKATCHEFLQTLYKQDAIYYKDQRIKNYVIGSKMFAIGSVYANNSSFIDAAQFELKEYADLHGRTVFITKRIDHKIVYVFKYQSDSTKIRTPEQVGTTTFDFLSNPVGECFSKFDEQLNEKDKVNTSIDFGYVLSNDKDNPHICTLAVPVFNFENRVVGCIVTKDLALDDCQIGDSIDEFIDIAINASKKLGYDGDFYS